MSIHRYSECSRKGNGTPLIVFFSRSALFFLMLPLLIQTGCQSSLKHLRLSDGMLSNTILNNSENRGLAVGDEVTAFNPLHISGPDAGTKHCPVCTYLEQPAILIFAQNSANTVSLANRLEALAEKHQPSDLNVFLVLTDGTAADIEQMARSNQLQHLSISLLDPATRTDDLRAWKIDSNRENTVVLYRDYIVLWKHVGLRSAEFDELELAVQSQLFAEEELIP